MKWFKKKKKPNEQVGFFFDHDGLPLTEEDCIFFPERTAVFKDVTTIHEQAFFPLCSVNMKVINPEWDFFGHFIYVFREQKEAIQYKKFYTPYCGDYSLGFDYKDGQYILHARPEMLAIAPYYEKYQQKAAEKYHRFAETYQEKGLESLLPYKATLNFLIKRFGKTPMWIEEDVVPKDMDGNPLVFVGQIRVLDFIGEGQYLYLFYSPKYHFFVQREQYR